MKWLITPTMLKKAAEAFPHDVYKGEEGDSLRWAFVVGFHQANKENALIPEDMGVIFNLVRECQTKYCETRGCYEEVLELFNKAKAESNK